MNTLDWKSCWDDRWTSLGITEQSLAACTLPYHPDASYLVSAGLDIFQREQYATPDTVANWLAMQAAAANDKIHISIVSAYRSTDYQCELIQKKLDQGQLIEDILCVNAIPGFSEHHSGCALDITCEGSEPLSESFDQTEAFNWLLDHAKTFHFYLSYPKDNKYNIIYEPWHWACIEPPN